MSNNKQSSVEWQFEQLSNSFETLKNTRLSFDEYFERNLEIRKQAKAMHKEEVERAHYEGSVIVISKPDDDMLQLSQQYYNETFGE